jgi:uncharacterized integral membrane protein
MQWTLICALIFALLTAVFAVVNVEPVRVNFAFAETTTPLILVILSSTLLGGLIVGLFGIIRQYRLQRRIRGLERRIQELESASSAVSVPAVIGDTSVATAAEATSAETAAAAGAEREGERP